MKVLLIDDEAVAARRLERLTRGVLGDELRVLTVAHGLSEAQHSLSAGAFDLILLDLNLSGDDGFALLADEIGGAAVIVVSAHADRAIEAFAHAVLDFVPKPVSEARLRQALERFQARPSHSLGNRLIVRSHGRADIIDIADIVRISGADDYSEILLTTGRTVLSERRLAELERTLHADFVRVHRSYVVNLRHVQAVESPATRPILRSKDGTATPVSRRRLARLKRQLRTLS